MGYSYYTLADGREAGYGVEAPCDAAGCTRQVWRGFDALCGDSPHTELTMPSPNTPGCGNYFCTEHEAKHDCSKPTCGTYPSDTEHAKDPCSRVAGHDGTHRDMGGVEFTLTEDDDQ